MKRALVALALALAACTSTRTSPGTAAAQFQIAQQREPASLNPALENGQSSTEWGFLLFSYLVKYDDRGRLVGDVATQAPTIENGGISRDGLTVTYHLRKGVRFADGSPLTAQDCVWSIDAINNPANNVQSRYGYDRIAKAQAPDAYTLVLHLKEPFAPLLTLVLAPQGFPILPQHVLAKYPDFNHIDFDQHPIGSGPYVVDRWIHGDRVIMHANPYYFRGKPKIERLTVRFVPDAQAALNLLQTHEIQGYFNEQDYSQYPQLRAVKGYRTTASPVAGVGALIFNTQDPATSDPRVRDALAQAIDIKSLVAKAYRGAVSSPGAGRGLFFWALDPKAYPDIAYDPAHARALLDAAGWKPGPDGLRRKNGAALDLQMIIQAATPGDAIVGNSVTQYERAIGAHVSLKQFNITQFVAPANEGGPVYGGKFNVALYPFVNGDDPDTTDQFACANVPPHGYNKSRICDPRVDALLRQGQHTFEIAERKAIYARLEALLHEQLPIVLIYSRNEVDAFTDRLRGQSVSLDGAWWNVGQWSLAQP
ncbi:MAG TPA: peptide ABC transporter substrate-binding protein [Candidatus Baltobacteraceae bacterium]|nr:peptide ABC transporter substrate-binding protein [Candidatus Baltobacteraceae bacterium]